MTGHGDIRMTVKAMKARAIGFLEKFLEKPLPDEGMLDAVRLGLEQDRTRRQRQKATCGPNTGAARAGSDEQADCWQWGWPK
jgi:FixJ family two-component response regulator